MQANSDINNNSTTLLKAAWLIAVVTIFSKLIGFIRDLIVAHNYGASTVSDAYFYATQIPSLAIILLGGVGGPFHSATVAVFSKLIPDFNSKPTEEINRLYNTFLTVTFLFFLTCSILCYIFSSQIMGLIISAGSPELVNLATQHFKIMSPVVLIGGVIGIYYGILISYKQFILPNLSPIVLSGVIILGITIFHNDKTGIVLAWATTIGALCQLLIQFPKVRQIGFRIRPNLDIMNNIQFQNICELLFPAILSSTIGQINIYIDMFFASSLKEGAWTSVVFANRIFQFPVGILVTAFLVPLFPIFSRLVGQNDFESIKKYFNKGVGVLLFVAFPVIIAILTVGLDGISLIFERGAFDANAVFMVTEALWFLSFSILPYVFRDSITRVYYSFNDSKTPFVIATSSIALKALMNYILIAKLHMGIAGITLSTSFVTLFNAVLLGIFINKKIKLDYKTLFINFLKMTIVAGITLLICLALAHGLDLYLHINKMLFQIIKITSVISICFIIYIGLCLQFKMDYTVELKNRIVERIKR